MSRLHYKTLEAPVVLTSYFSYESLKKGLVIL